MRYDEFIAHVEQASAPGDREDAARTAEVVLETLGERISKTESVKLAAQLPGELKGCLMRRQGHIGGTERGVHPYSLEEFYNRVGARCEVRHRAAVRRAHAVMAALRAAVTEGELRDVLAELPPEYDPLLLGTNSARPPAAT